MGWADAWDGQSQSHGQFFGDYAKDEGVGSDSLSWGVNVRRSSGHKVHDRDESAWGEAVREGLGC